MMRFTTYTKFTPGLADAVNLQALLDQLSDFLLQSGFGGGEADWPWWAPPPEGGDHSLDALRQAILDALLRSGQLTADMVRYLRGEPSEDETRDAAIAAQLAGLIDSLIERLLAEGYLKTRNLPDAPTGYSAVMGPGGQARAAAEQVQFDLTDKGLDFLGYRALKHLLGAAGQSSLGAHETRLLSTGIEAEGSSRPYQFGDTLNLDVPGTLASAIARHGLSVPLEIDYDDLQVHQSEYRSSAATVLMLDCSHSMILYGEDRFTPAKKVALALTHLIRTQFPGDTLKVVLFHDRAEEIPLAALPSAQVGPHHTNTAEGLKLARRLLMAQRKDMRQIIMITDGKPSAMTAPSGDVYVNAMGLDPEILAVTFREAAACRQSGIVINTFMLAREPSLVEFVKRISQICRGKAYFTSTLTLGQFILMDFMRRRTTRG